MKKIILLVITILLCGCVKTEKTNYKEIMQKNDYLIIDVRTMEEYNTLHIVDAINIPLDSMDEKINISKDLIIFVYCKSGNRSSIAAEKLENLGYKVYDLGSIYDIDLPKE